MSKNKVTKPVAINNIEVWLVMCKDNFFKKVILRLQF